MVAVEFADEKATANTQRRSITGYMEQEVEDAFYPPKLLRSLWLFTESDFATFVIPDTCFGLFGALAGSLLTTNTNAQLLPILYRSILALIFNWANLLIFDLANQGTYEAVLEDSINKSWRPIPTGRISVTQTKRLLMCSIPLVLACNWYLGGWRETSLLFHLTWMYNHLGGGEENFIVRNTIIAFAFGLYNAGSLRIASGLDSEVSSMGYQWTILISCVIFTTMHVQDMKDQVGDALRERRTCPLVLGDMVARWTIAVPVAIWSVICPWFFGVGVNGYLVPCGLGTMIVLRILLLNEQHHDRRTWKMWTAWTAVLYFLPVVANPDVVLKGLSAGLQVVQNHTFL